MVKEILLSQIQDLMPFDKDCSTGVEKLSFKNLNPRKYCEELGTVVVTDAKKLKENTLSNYPDLNNETKYIGKYACRFKLTKAGQTEAKEVIGLGSNENSAIFNAAQRMLAKIAQ